MSHLGQEVLPDERNIQVNCYNLKLSELQGIIQESFSRDDALVLCYIGLPYMDGSDCKARL